MSEADLFRLYADRFNIETSADKELFLEVVTQLQSEGVEATHEVFTAIKATVDLMKEMSEKGRT
jgi:hypothetical protein